MASSSQPVTPQPPRGHRPGRRIDQFWQHVTDGLEVTELWKQFSSDARATYRLYSREISPPPKELLKKRKRWWYTWRQFFWAVLEKLSPARRVLLLIALVLIIVNPEFAFMSNSVTRAFGLDTRFWGGMLMFLLLILEVTDRIVMKRDIQIAREIQTWLLPATAPQISGLEMAFVTRPANTVAGDYYDVFPRPAKANQPTYLIVVADVVGKSIPAALLMATFQASLKTLSDTSSSLAELVAGMNHYTCCNSQGGLRFTTAFLAEYEPASRALTYINAGHNRPILLRLNGQIERLDRGGLPLGIKPDVTYETATVNLQCGDWLLIFTDGVVETVNESGSEYGEDRLLYFLTGGANSSPAEVLNRIMLDLDLFAANTPRPDDVTCLLIKAV